MLLFGPQIYDYDNSGYDNILLVYLLFLLFLFDILLYFFKLLLTEAKDSELSLSSYSILDFRLCLTFTCLGMYSIYKFLIETLFPDEILKSELFI